MCIQQQYGSLDPEPRLYNAAKAKILKYIIIANSL